MAKDTQLSNATASVAADAVAPLCNNGYIRVYTAPKPATGDTALAGQTLLAEYRFPATAFGAAVNGLLTSNAIAAVVGLADGTAAWFRIFRSDGSTIVMDGTVATSGANLNLPSVAITMGGAVPGGTLTVDILKSVTGE